MKYNFDYVSFDDYEKDLADLASQATTATASLRRERDNWKNLATAIIHAVGSVKLHESYLRTGQNHD